MCGYVETFSRRRRERESKPRGARTMCREHEMADAQRERSEILARARWTLHGRPSGTGRPRPVWDLFYNSSRDTDTRTITSHSLPLSLASLSTHHSTGDRDSSSPLLAARRLCGIEGGRSTGVHQSARLALTHSLSLALSPARVSRPLCRSPPTTRHTSTPPPPPPLLASCSPPPALP